MSDITPEDFMRGMQSPEPDPAPASVPPAPPPPHITHGQFTPGQYRDYVKLVRDKNTTPDQLNEWMTNQVGGGMTNAADLLNFVKKSPGSRIPNYWMRDQSAPNPHPQPGSPTDFLPDGLQQTVEQLGVQTGLIDPKTYYGLGNYGANAQRPDASPVASNPRLPTFNERMARSMSETFSPVGGGLNALLMRANEDVAHDEFIRQYGSDHNWTGDQIDAALAQGKADRGRQLNDIREERAIRDADEARRQGGGIVGSAERGLADLVGGIVGDTNPAYAFAPEMKGVAAGAEKLAPAASRLVGKILPRLAAKGAIPVIQRGVEAAAPAVGRAAGQAAVQGGVDVASQADEIQNSMREHYDPAQTIERAGLGALIQGGVDALGGALSHLQGGPEAPSAGASTPTRAIDTAHDGSKLRAENDEGLGRGLLPMSRAEQDWHEHNRSDPEAHQAWLDKADALRAEMVKATGIHHEDTPPANEPNTHDEYPVNRAIADYAAEHNLDHVEVGRHYFAGNDPGLKDEIDARADKIATDIAPEASSGSPSEGRYRELQDHFVKTQKDFASGLITKGERDSEINRLMPEFVRLKAEIGVPDSADYPAGQKPVITPKEPANDTGVGVWYEHPEAFEGGNYGFVPQGPKTLENGSHVLKYSVFERDGNKKVSDDLIFDPREGYASFPEKLTNEHTDSEDAIFDAFDSSFGSSHGIFETEVRKLVRYERSLKDAASTSASMKKSDGAPAPGNVRDFDSFRYKKWAEEDEKSLKETERKHVAELEDHYWNTRHILDAVRSGDERMTLAEIKELREASGIDFLHEKMSSSSLPMLGHDIVKDEAAIWDEIEKYATDSDPEDVDIGGAGGGDSGGGGNEGTGGEGGEGGEPPSSFDDIVARLTEALKKATRLTEKQKELYSAERSARLRKSLDAAKSVEGEPGVYASLAALKGELPKIDFTPTRGEFTQDEVNSLFQYIKNSKKYAGYESLNTSLALIKMLDGKVPTPSEMSLLSRVFPDAFLKAALKHRALGGKILNVVGEAVNLPRALMSSIDVSAPFRQGWLLMGRKEFWKAMGPMFKYLVSPKAYEGLMESIRESPTYHLAEQSGLSITEMGRDLANREERFQSTWAERMPIVGAGVKASERAYNGFLNKLRFDTFNSIVELSRKGDINFNKNPKALKDIASFVNNATGRGSLGRLNDAAPIFNGLFFSPRLLASRVTMLNPVYYTKLSPVVRREAVKATLAAGGIALTALSLASIAGYKVVKNVVSSDFGKIIDGNLRHEILGGFGSYLTFGARLLLNRTQTLAGDEKPLGTGKYGTRSRLNVTEDFFRGKLSPVASLVADYLDGKNQVGTPFTWSSALAQRVTPLFLQDLASVIQDKGFVKGVFSSLDGALGDGLQDFVSTPTKTQFMQGATPSKPSVPSAPTPPLAPAKGQTQAEISPDDFIKGMDSPAPSAPRPAPEPAHTTFENSIASQVLADQLGLRITDNGVRSHEDQARYYRTTKGVATPGSSDHEIGNAVDVGVPRNVSPGKIVSTLTAAGFKGVEVITRRHGTAPHWHIQWAGTE